MNAELLKDRLRECLWQVVDRHDAVLSATLTGSFVDSPSLEGISDIDFVLVLDRLDRRRYDGLLADFDAALRPVLRGAGYGLRLNPTLGPLKFNDADTAVLHLMLYSQAAHVDHVIHSPFTCLDWQRSAHYRKQSLADVYPVFGLQPRHFLGARRGLQDYLRDFRANCVSYRELACSDDGYREEKRSKPMTPRDRHEFAYHVIRFLMRNLLKLVRRSQDVPAGPALLNDFFEIFPEGGEEATDFFRQLAARKHALDFTEPLPNLDRRLEAFVAGFESQFRRVFFTEATRHVVFRHAPTALNGPAGDGIAFLGRSDPDIVTGQPPEAWQRLAEAVREVEPWAVYSSPLRRCRQTLNRLADSIRLPEVCMDDRLLEIDYGAAEGMTVGAARQAHRELFAAWERQLDPRFPGGENTGDVVRRVSDFACERWADAGGNTVTCTHNVVLRCLVGQALSVPAPLWHRLRIPHLAPLTFVLTRQFGLFVELPESVEREVFRDFAGPAEG